MGHAAAEPRTRIKFRHMPDEPSDARTARTPRRTRCTRSELSDPNAMHSLTAARTLYYVRVAVPRPFSTSGTRPRPCRSGRGGSGQSRSRRTASGSLATDQTDRMSASSLLCDARLGLGAAHCAPACRSPVAPAPLPPSQAPSEAADRLTKHGVLLVILSLAVEPDESPKVVVCHDLLERHHKLAPALLAGGRLCLVLADLAQLGVVKVLGEGLLERGVDDVVPPDNGRGELVLEGAG